MTSWSATINRREWVYRYSTWKKGEWFDLDINQVQLIVSNMEALDNYRLRMAAGRWIVFEWINQAWMKEGWKDLPSECYLIFYHREV